MTLDKLDKKITTVYLCIDIKEYIERNKINLSEWVNTEFRERYLSIHTKTKRLAEIHSEAEQLQKDIKAIKERQENMNLSLTVAEKRYIGQVTDQLRKGFKLPAMLIWFNNEYHRDYSLDDFKQLVDHFRQESQRRTEIAIEKKNKKHKKRH